LNFFFFKFIFILFIFLVVFITNTRGLCGWMCSSGREMC
jgi:hypothetical protein